MLISDEKIEKSACSISVGVGSLEDPDHALGLAHFLEHMIFMGSENYPDYNSYSKFLTNNCGDSDAHTDDDETNYYFSIKNSAFVEAIDRFLDFFIHPLLSNECIEK